MHSKQQTYQGTLGKQEQNPMGQRRAVQGPINGPCNHQTIGRLGIHLLYYTLCSPFKRLVNILGIL